MPSNDPRAQFSEQIARLQRRQFELVQQTSEELEALKREVESDGSFEERLRQEQEPLVRQLAELKDAVGTLYAQREVQDQRLRAMQDRLDSYQATVQGTVRGAKESIKESFAHLDREMRSVSETLGSAFESLEGSLETAPAPAQPKATAPQPLPAAPKQAPRRLFGKKNEALPEAKKPEPAKLPLAPEPVAIEAPKDVPKLPKPKRKGGLKRLAVRTVTLCLLGAGGYAGYNHLMQPPLEVGQVAGISTQAVSTPSTATVTEDYSQSFADLPFEQTVWERSIDPDFGVSLEYPSNTSNRIHTVGGSNLWFLRKNGYLLKISRVETEATLDAWTEEQKEADSSLITSKTTFKGQPAYLAKFETVQVAPGYQYFVKKGDVIFTVWIKDEDPASDDGQRIARMITSLQFTN